MADRQQLRLRAGKRPQCSTGLFLAPHSESNCPLRRQFQTIVASPISAYAQIATRQSRPLLVGSGPSSLFSGAAAECVGAAPLLCDGPSCLVFQEGTNVGHEEGVESHRMHGGSRGQQARD